MVSILFTENNQLQALYLLGNETQYTCLSHEFHILIKGIIAQFDDKLSLFILRYQILQ